MCGVILGHAATSSARLLLWHMVCRAGLGGRGRAEGGALRVPLLAIAKVAAQSLAENDLLGRSLKTQRVTALLCAARGRAQLESCVQLWALHSKNDVDQLKRVRKRATEMMPG